MSTQAKDPVAKKPTEVKGPKRPLVDEQPEPLRGYCLILDPLFDLDMEEELKFIPKSEHDSWIAENAVRVWDRIEVLDIGPEVEPESKIVAGGFYATCIDHINRGTIEMGQYLFVSKTAFHAKVG